MRRRKWPVIEILYVLAIVAGIAAARLAERYAPRLQREEVQSPARQVEPRAAEPAPWASR
jgi:hypothetical protein